ncbi:hypothetical protein BCL90_0970 [Pedobacter alluvionis]|uniref:Uncharacterized protein n=1 Tax=Pedobacter alluvionis TaxID=475253 RepID=A0A497YJ33_9SPHI|nr:hypothetical protein BCL90_0970 [Pedobacter alluvionis]
MPNSPLSKLALSKAKVVLLILKKELYTSHLEWEAIDFPILLKDLKIDDLSLQVEDDAPRKEHYHSLYLICASAWPPWALR